MKFRVFQCLILLGLLFQLTIFSAIDAKEWNLKRRNRIALYHKSVNHPRNLKQEQTSLLIRDLAVGNRWMLSKPQPKPHPVRHRRPEKTREKVLSTSIIAQGRLAAKLIQSTKRVVSYSASTNGRSAYEMATNYRKVTQENAAVGRRAWESMQTKLQETFADEP